MQCIESDTQKMGRPEVFIKRLLAAWMNKPSFERRAERGYPNRSNPRLPQDDGGLRLPFFDLLEFSLGSVFVLCEHNLKSLCTICPRPFGTDLRSGCSRPSGPFRVLNCWPAVSMYMTPMPVLSAAALPLIDWSGFVAGIALLVFIQVTMAERLTIVSLLMITTRALDDCN